MAHTKGFTIIELIVSIAIFAGMTALVVARYGTFSQSTLLTNMAYDVALLVRTAQTYGLSVKSVQVNNTDVFNRSYGLHFDMSPTQTNKIVFFTDTNSNYIYNSGEEISTYTLTQGAHISQICLGSDLGSCTQLDQTNTLDITYKRPNPNAIVYCLSGAAACTSISSNPITEPVVLLTLASSNGAYTQTVYIRRNGQISVGN
jgi:prepilin-type N-terminal cleavage/methylation domain-containing protein